MQAREGQTMKRIRRWAISAVIAVGVLVYGHGNANEGEFMDGKPLPGKSYGPAVALSPKCADLPGSYPANGDKHAFALCWQELDDVPGCHVYRGHYHTGESARVVGPGWTPQTLRWRAWECRGGLLASGMLTIESDEGVFEGPVVDGKLNGHWGEGYADGGRDEGRYVDGERNGHWVQRYADGRVDEGPYVDGKQNGHWVVRYADGRVEEGPVVDGEKSGPWVKRSADGAVEEECWRAGVRVEGGPRDGCN